MSSIAPAYAVEAERCTPITADERKNALLKPKAIPQSELDMIIDNLPMKGETEDPKKKKK